MNNYQIHRLTQEYFNMLIENSIKENDVQEINRIEKDLIITTNEKKIKKRIY